MAKVLEEIPLTAGEEAIRPPTVSEEQPLSAQESLSAEKTLRLQTRMRRGPLPAEDPTLEKDIDYKTGAPFGVMTDFETASNPDEAKAILAAQYGEENIGQDRAGRWWFKDPKTGKRTSVSPAFLSSIAASAPQTGGAIAGAAAGGALGGPPGAIIGAGLGGMLGKGLVEAEKYGHGVSRKGFVETAKEIGTEGALQAGATALPIIGKPAMQAAGSAYRNFIGVTPESSRRGISLLERGAIPPVVSVATEASTAAKRQDLASIVSHKRLFGSHEQNIEFVDQQMRKELAKAGVPANEIDDFMRNVATKQETVSTTDTGRSIVREAQQRVADARATIDADLAQARSALETRVRQIEATAHAPDNFGEAAADAINRARTDFGVQMSAAYRRVHELAGSERAVDMRPVMEAAQQVVAEMRANPEAVPATIRRLAQGERSVPIGEPPGAPAPGQPPPGPRPREWQEFEDLESAHNLRNDLRQDLRKQSLTLTPGVQRAMIDRVESALDDSITMLANNPGSLPAEAARELRRVDGLYREGIQRFRNKAAQQLVNDARDGIFADPGVVAQTIFRPGQVAQAREIMSMLPAPVQEQAAQAHLGNLLRRSATMDEQTGRQVLDGRSVLKILDDPRERELMNVVFGQGFQQDLRNLATEYLALNGKLPLEAVQPSTVRNMLARANSRAREIDTFVRDNPVGALASGDPQVVDAAVRTVSQPGKEEATIQAYRALQATPEGQAAWQAVQRDNLKLMFSDVFGRHQSGTRTIDGKVLFDRMGKYTKTQKELLFPGGLGDDIMELSKDINFLFPPSLLPGAGGRTHSSLSAGAISSHFWLRLPSRMWNYTADWMLRRPQVVRWLADELRSTPGKAYRRAVMGATGRMIMNEMLTGPGTGRPDEGQAGPDKRSSLAGQRFAMADPQFQPGREELPAGTPNEVVQQGFGTVTKDNLQRGMDINRLWNETEENRYFSPSKFPTIEPGTRTRRGTVISDADERPIAGQQYAMADEETRRGRAGFGLGVRGGSGGGGGAPPKEDIAVRGQGGEIATRGGYKYDDLGVRAGKLRSDARFDPANEDAMRGARVGEDALARFADATQQGMPRAQMIQHPDLWRTASQFSRATGMSLTESFRSLVSAATGYPLSSTEIKLISELAMKTGIR